jgi:predicted nucleic acid-binding protein
VRIVIDTNVLVSGLLTPRGPPGRIVDGLLLGELVPVFDDRILREYALVLARPRFRFDPVGAAAGAACTHRQRRPAHVASVLEYLERAGEPVVAPPLPVALLDAADRAFLAVARQADVSALVTGNLRHLPAECRGPVRVEAPGPFVECWAVTRGR